MAPPGKHRPANAVTAVPDPPPPPWRPVLLSPTSCPSLRATWAVRLSARVSLAPSCELAHWGAASDQGAGRTVVLCPAARRPGHASGRTGPWDAARLSRHPESPPRRALWTPGFLHHGYPQIGCGPAGRGRNPGNTTQASSAGSRPNPGPSLSSAAHPGPSLFPSLDLSLFRSTKGSFLDTSQQEEETVKSLSANKLWSCSAPPTPLSLEVYDLQPLTSCPLPTFCHQRCARGLSQTRLRDGWGFRVQ